MSLNKSDLIEVLAARLSITYTEAERMLNAFINLVYESLKNGEKVNISGFGQFSVSHRAPRIGVNPRNPSQKIQIPELNTPKFKAGEAFKEAVKLRKGNNHSQE
ncbi:MAG TPA: HU family DNA-binding protein [Candidatus Doudnabacteria bacterium]|nr:HU family DNA-binding protein [Candidatus Doudnabacteria bacterium]